MNSRKKIINELRFQLDSKEVKDQHYPIQLSASDANAILTLLEEREAQGWISVKDRMPEHGQTVLAWEVSGFVYVDNYDGEHDVFRIAYNNSGTVTHWQSLPEPPEEGDERV